MHGFIQGNASNMLCLYFKRKLRGEESLNVVWCKYLTNHYTDILATVGMGSMAKHFLLKPIIVDFYIFFLFIKYLKVKN